MTAARWAILGALTCGVGFGQLAAAAPIGMPAGSKVWMKFEASACPDADGDDCLGSNQAGPNPPNGIPLSTFTSSNDSATGFAEILPGSIDIFASNNLSIGVWGSYEDTYTITGSATGPFNIPVEFHVTGEARSVGQNCPFEGCHVLFGANSFAKIGVFNTSTDGFFGEDLRVTAFDAEAREDVLFPFESSAVQFSHPIDLTASYTVQNVNVGDTFTLAFSTKARASRGEFDILGTVSFDLPEGVSLVSSLAESLAGLPGDYNHDGVVDAADYVTWRKSPDDHGGDPAGYETWRTNFGNSSGSGAEDNPAVPEPTSLTFFLAVALVIASRPHAR